MMCGVGGVVEFGDKLFSQSVRNGFEDDEVKLFPPRKNKHPSA